jgi:hypothetical protein|tara:strand:- start:22863 stop:23000 length:138 start_codon:yes stop_codon:yes gene_type:complete
MTREGHRLVRGAHPATANAAVDAIAADAITSAARRVLQPIDVIYP